MYRKYDAQRIEANNAIMALLAGSKLAENVLNLTTGSSHRLAEIFPQVSNIERLNLKTSEAQTILASAENHVGGMAIPYVLSIHEDYIVGLCRLLAEVGRISKTKLKDVSPSNMHENLESAGPGRFGSDTLRLFHFLRLVRNAQIHYAGRVHPALAKYRADLSSTDETKWEQITGEKIGRFSEGGELGLSIFELIATLAISKRLAEEANELVQESLPRVNWLGVIVDDWSSTPRVGNTSTKIRNASGFARFDYGPLAVTKHEIETALKDKGLI